MRASVVVASSLLLLGLLAGCGASLDREPLVLGVGDPQPHSLELAGGTRAGWVLVSHDEQAVSVTWVMNPGWTMASGSLCARSEAFGWIDPAACERHVAESSGTTTVTIPFAALGGVERACERAFFLQVQADVIDEETGAAAGSAYAGTFKGRIALVPECRPAVAAVGCVRNEAEWLATSEWPLDGAKLGASTYSNVEMAALLDADAQSDASVLLADALIAARLNVAAGAEPAMVASAAIDDAQSWLVKYGSGNERLPYGLKVSAEGSPNAPGWDEGVNASALLSRFDEGFAGAPRCER